MMEPKGKTLKQQKLLPWYIITVPSSRRTIGFFGTYIVLPAMEGVNILNIKILSRATKGKVTPDQKNKKSK